MDIIVKKLLEADLLFPGYEKDLEFIKSASKIFTFGKFNDRAVLDNALEDLSKSDITHKVNNWYVFLTCIPNITSAKTKASMLNWLEQWPPICSYLDKTILYEKIPEFLNPSPANQNDTPNIKW